MSDKFFAVINREALFQLFENFLRRRNSRNCKGFVLPVGYLGSNKITAFSLNMSCNAARTSFSEDGIAFPMTKT